MKNSNPFNLEHTRHSMTRAAQRGINDEILDQAIDYAQMFFKQGYIFYVVTGKSLPDTLKGSLRNKLENLVIVTAGDSNRIITVYKSNNALKHIRKKRCDLVDGCRKVA
ncbi:MAG: hypothetical protein KBC43_12845 [Bacteroidales bacterium]|nr:hypothetical protein [Bacteroidales bacterium]